MHNIHFNTFISLSDIETQGKPFPSSLYSYWKAWVRGPFICGDRAPGTNGLRLFAFNIRSLFQSNSYHRQVFSSYSFVSEEAQEIPRNTPSQDWQEMANDWSIPDYHSALVLGPTYPVQTLGIIWDLWHYIYRILWEALAFFGILQDS